RSCFRRNFRQPPPLLTSDHAQGLAQSVAQQIIGILDATSSPQRAAVEGRPQGARTEGSSCCRYLNGPLDQPSVHLRRYQPLAEVHQSPEALGRLATIQTVQDELPASIHRGGFNNFIVGSSHIGLQDRSQR